MRTIKRERERASTKKKSNKATTKPRFLSFCICVCVVPYLTYLAVIICFVEIMIYAK
jgi:hypothetical protein